MPVVINSQNRRSWWITKLVGLGWITSPPELPGRVFRGPQPEICKQWDQSGHDINIHVLDVSHLQQGQDYFFWVGADPSWGCFLAEIQNPNNFNNWAKIWYKEIKDIRLLIYIHIKNYSTISKSQNDGNMIGVNIIYIYIYILYDIILEPLFHLFGYYQTPLISVLVVKPHDIGGSPFRLLG